MPAQTPEQCDELGTYVNSRDLDNLVALYEPRASLGNEDGTVAHGTAAIRETMRGIFAAFPEVKITMNVVRVVHAGDDPRGALQRLDREGKGRRWFSVRDGT
jgi:ketosteroid isomerase-like protein